MRIMAWASTAVLRRLTVDQTVKDYMKIEYSKGSCLYILATQLDAIQKYSSADGEKAPKLNTLGGQDWKKTKTKCGRCTGGGKGSGGALCGPSDGERLCVRTRYSLAEGV